MAQGTRGALQRCLMIASIIVYGTILSYLFAAAVLVTLLLLIKVAFFWLWLPIPFSRLLEALESDPRGPRTSSLPRRKRDR